MIKFCKWKGVEIIEAEVFSVYIQMIVSMLPKLSIVQFMGYINGKSSIMIFYKYANLNSNMRIELFCREYYIDTVGINKTSIEKYIINQSNKI